MSAFPKSLSAVFGCILFIRSGDFMKLRLGLAAQFSALFSIALVVVFSSFIIVSSVPIEKFSFDDKTKVLGGNVDALRDILEAKLAELRVSASLLAENDSVSRAFDSGDFQSVASVLESFSAMSPFLENVFVFSGEGYIQAGLHGSTGQDIRSFPFFSAVTQGKTDRFVDSYAYSSPTTKHAVILFGSPVVKKAKIVGGVIIALDLTLLSQELIQKKVFGSDGYAFIVDDRGHFVAHPRADLILKDSSNEEVVRKLLESKSASGHFAYVFDGTEKMLSYTRLGTVPWFVCANVRDADLHALSTKVRSVLILTSLVALAVLIASLVWAMRTFVGSRLGILEKSMLIVAGGDLTLRNAVKGNDELSTINRSYNSLLDSFSVFLRSVQDQASVMSETGNTLSANVTQTSASVEQIRANIESARKQIIRQKDNTDETASAVEELISNTESLDRLIRDQSTSVDQSSAAIEEMTANVSSIAQLTSNAVTEVSAMNAAVSKGNESLEQVLDIIKEIASESERLQEANVLISNIASQTNLLSMNAAIEAAHAGEAGKGFSVVSDEIRKLSENSAGQSREVSSNLARIAAAIEKAKESSRTTSDEFARMKAVIEKVTTLFNQFDQSLREQSAGGSQVLEGLSQIRTIAEQVKTGSAEMMVGNRRILSIVSDLTEISGVTGGALEEISAAIVQIGNSMQEMLDVAEKNREGIAEIIENSHRFTV